MLLSPEFNWTGKGLLPNPFIRDVSAAVNPADFVASLSRLLSFLCVDPAVSGESEVWQNVSECVLSLLVAVFIAFPDLFPPQLGLILSALQARGVEMRGGTCYLLKLLLRHSAKDAPAVLAGIVAEIEAERKNQELFKAMKTALKFGNSDPKLLTRTFQASVAVLSALERNPEEEDDLLHAVLAALRRLTTTHAEDFNHLRLFLLRSCLFPMQFDLRTAALCKTHPCRRVAFQLLLQISRGEEEILFLHNFFLQLHREEDGRRLPWTYRPDFQERSRTGYSGLVNLGATCYANSMMQQLFMVPEFRYGNLTLVLA